MIAPIYVPDDDYSGRNIESEYGLPHDEYGVPVTTTTTQAPFVPIPAGPEILPLLVPEIPREVYIEPVIQQDEYGPPALPPIIQAAPEIPHEDYGPPPPPPPPPAPVPVPHDEYGPPPTPAPLPIPAPYPLPEIITTTLPPTTVVTAPYPAPVTTTTTTTSAPYPAPYPHRVESHYDGQSGIFRSETGVLRQVAVQRPSHLGTGPVAFETGRRF